MKRVMLATSIKKPFLVILYGLKSCDGGKCTPTATLGPKTGGNYYEYAASLLPAPLPGRARLRLKRVFFLSPPPPPPSTAPRA